MITEKYWMDNLPLIIPLFILSTLFILFCLFILCRQLKKNVVASATRSLYNLTASPRPKHANNQSTSTGRSSVRRSLRQGVAGVTSDESEDHPGFELIASAMSPNTQRLTRAQDIHMARGGMWSSSGLPGDGRARTFAVMPFGMSATGFDSYPDETAESTLSTDEPQYHVINYENETDRPWGLDPIEAKRLHHQRRKMSGSSHYMRRHSSSGVTGRRHSTRLNRGHKKRRDIVAMSHPSASKSTSRLQQSQLIRFQSDQMTGNYPQCLMDPLPQNSARFLSLQTDGRPQTLNRKRSAAERKREHEFSAVSGGLGSVNRSGLPWSQLMYDKTGRRRAVQVVEGLASGELKLEDLADFGLTPVAEVSGVSGSLLRDQVHYKGDHLLVSSGAERVPYQQEGHVKQFANAVVIPPSMQESENAISNNMHRYSTPLPPYTLHYLSRPSHYTQQYGDFQRVQPQMVRFNSKASSGINSVATNQSLRTYYTNHNDIAHSISSISFNSSLSFVPTEEIHNDNAVHRGGVVTTAGENRFHDLGRQAKQARHALNVSHGRHYSSDSELDAHVLVTGQNPGSRKSMSRALNLHPIEMDMPIASGRAGATAGQIDQSKNKENHSKEKSQFPLANPHSTTDLTGLVMKKPNIDLTRPNRQSTGAKQQEGQQENQQWV
ncbi:uncharacterized protein LOC142336162 isoform X2 [Convolutriloba macropyga]|uniref:uncharacterized protein LOC142336162 isoform X2 n=1 Tax=Convolutriloba macropyga TaxID=536237 RepID=UPI003F522F7E